MRIHPADLGRRIEWMDRAEVATQVLAASPQVPSTPKTKDSLAAAHMINDEYAQIVADSPGRFLAYGALPLPRVEASVQEIDRIFDDLKFAGVTITTILPGNVSRAQGSGSGVVAA